MICCVVDKLSYTAANDVTKQDSLGKFYQQLLKQKVSSPTEDVGVDIKVPESGNKATTVIATNVSCHGNEQPPEVDLEIFTQEEAKSLSDSVPSKRDAMGGSNDRSSTQSALPSVSTGTVDSSTQPEGAKCDPFAKRTDLKALESARSRYLARRRARQSH